MRGVLAAVAVSFLLAAPSFAQQLSPLTGTTSTPPATSATVPPALGAGQAPAARPSRRMRFKERFDAANTTHDGRLTLEQARGGHMPQVVRNFDAIDAGHKGYVTTDDIAAYRRAQRQARKAAKP